MDYIFGTSSLTGGETLKTKGKEFTNLAGWQEVVQEFQDSTRTDRFKVTRKVKEDTDTEGNHYTWYEISDHNTIIDRTGPVAEREKKNAANIDYLSMMTGVELPETEEEGDVNG